MFKILGADQKDYGPVAADVIRQWIAERRLNRQSLAQAEGTAGWRPLSQFPEFAAALAEAAPPVPAIAPTESIALPSGTNGMAITSVIMGLLGIPSMCCCVPIFSILGIAFAIVAFSQLRENPNQTGKGLAWTGLLLSIIGMLLFVVLLLGGSASWLQGLGE
jgi:hypothetical protein